MRKYQAVFWLALILRLLFWAAWAWKGLDAVFTRDLYYSLAQSWLGWTAPYAMDATHPPFYTLFIAGVLWIFRNPNPAPVLVLQAIFSAAACPLAGRIGELLVSERVGRLAAFWAAFDPALIFFAPQLQTETLFVFMELVFFVWFYGLLDSVGSRWVWLGLGVWGGLSALCRSVFAAYPALLLPALWGAKGRRKTWLASAFLALGWLIPISAWTARNWMKYHQFIPISAQMGWTLYEGFSTDREEVRRRPFEMAEEAARLGISDPVARSGYFKAKTLALIQERPAEALRIILGKTFLYWRPWLYDPYPRWISLPLSVYFSALFLLAGYGAWTNRFEAMRWMPVYGLFLYLTAMHSLFFTSLRYRLPLEPFLCLLAATGFDSVMRRRQLPPDRRTQH